MDQLSTYEKILKNRTEPVLYEDDEWFIVLALHPWNEGHLLLIPKEKVSEFFYLSKDTLQKGFEIATQVAKLIKATYTPPRVAMVIKGFTKEDHAHIHISPLYSSTDTERGDTKPALTNAEMEVVASKLQPLITKAME